MQRNDFDHAKGKSMDDAKLHADGSVQWDASDVVLDWFKANLKPDMRTIETGAGKSTLAFMEAGCLHDCVTPSSSEVSAIKTEAARRGLPAEKATFHVDFSQNVLPHLKGHEDIDVAFIDGGHGFPIPAVDWMYIAPRIKVGGKLLIDDIDLWTGAMLVDVMAKEPGWRIDKVLRGRTVIITKTAPFQAREWVDQPTVVAKSFIPQTLRKIVNGFSLLARLDFKAVSRKLKHERALLDVARGG
jgi:Methyltransferase domain